jgi:hypothetical protein
MINITQVIEAAIHQAIEQAVQKAVSESINLINTTDMVTIRDIIDVVKSASDEDRQALREALDVRVDLDDVRDCVDAVIETSLKNQIQPLINDALENISAEDIDDLDRVVTRIVTEDIEFSVSAN